MALEELSRRIVGSAITVHRALGPGLLENTYRVCMVRQLQNDGLAVKQEVPIGITYGDLVMPVAYRADLIVEESVLVELKSIERIQPIHEFQVNTYLRHACLPVGLLINFNVAVLHGGVRRLTR